MSFSSIRLGIVLSAGFLFWMVLVPLYAQDTDGTVRDKMRQRVILHNDSKRYPMVTLSEDVTGEVAKRFVDIVVIRPSNLGCVKKGKVLEITHGSLGDLTVECVNP